MSECSEKGCHGQARECCMSDPCIYCDERCGGNPAKNALTPEERCRQFHVVYEREAAQGNGWRFKEGCPVCGNRTPKPKLTLVCLPTRYELYPKGRSDLMVQLVLRDDREPQKWAIFTESHQLCLNRDLEWEYEPLPSSRTDEWKAQCRFSLEEAKQIAERYFEKEL